MQANKHKRMHSLHVSGLHAQSEQFAYIKCTDDTHMEESKCKLENFDS